MASDIFISYAREDRELASALAEVLLAQGWSVWWDRVIPPGKTWDEVIESELTTTRVVIVIWSTHSVQSRWVRAEAAEAMDRNILIPVRVAEITPPLAFRHLQAADLQAWSGNLRDARLLQLLDALKTVAKASTPPKPSERTEEASVAPAEEVTSIEEGTVRRITDLYEDWQRSSDQELVMLAEMEIRETVGKYLEWRGENRREADKGKFEAVIAIARRIGLLRGRATTSGAHLATLRLDGLYQSKRSSGYLASTEYLRFFPDGSVISVTSTGNASEVASWFTRDNADLSKGNYSVNGTTVRFSSTSPEGTVEYEGEILGQKLALRRHSHVTGHRDVQEYTRVEV
jgi:hypothetical protein